MQLDASRRVSTHLIMMDVAASAPARRKQQRLTTQSGSNRSQTPNLSGASSAFKSRTTQRPASLSSC